MDQQMPVSTPPTLVIGSNKFLKHFIEWGVLLLFVLFSAAAIVQYRSGFSITRDLASAQAAFDANSLDDAVQLASQILARDPKNVQAMLIKASALAQEGSLQFKEKEYGPQAIAIAQQALVLQPDNVDAMRIIGYSNEIMQNYVDAHSWYGKALTIDPKNAPIISQNAHAYDLQGDAQHAMLGYYQALQIDPNLTQAQMGYGRSLMRMGRLADAEKMFARVSRTAANARQKAEGAYSASVVENALGDRANAEANVRIATTLDPTYALAWVGLGTMLFQESIATSTSLSMQQRQELGMQSFAVLQKAIQINPGQSLARLQVGIQLATLGKISDAQKEFASAKQLAQTDITLGTLEKAAMIQRIDATAAFYASKK